MKTFKEYISEGSDYINHAGHVKDTKKVIKKDVSEKIIKVNDEKMDALLKDKDIVTFKQNVDLMFDFSKVTNIYQTQDTKFFHIVNDKTTKDKIKEYKDKIVESNE